MKKELRSKKYGASGTIISVIGFLLSALAGATCAYIFDFFSFEGCPDETNIILGVIVFAVSEFSVLTKCKTLSGIRDVLELGEELEAKMELISGVEVISDGLEEEQPVPVNVEPKKEKKGLLHSNKKEEPEHVHALLRNDDELTQRSSGIPATPVPPVPKTPVPTQSTMEPKKTAMPKRSLTSEPVVSPIRSASDPVIQRAPEPVVSPIRSASDPVVQRAPEPVVSPIRSASDPVVQRAPEPVVSQIKSASDSVVQRAPEPVEEPKKKATDDFVLMFEEATDDML